ncbi:PREDICTED: TELO2-interacting protein 1 homolog [Polistes dominula]|uniref:TELO2-interacting protein 1 homolog n=1 Tax=Polistes dominula TaxID=743375 RepID=A0ABM1IR17_POLDO|nr:PREDICTED: TELO2-interacting protein 1 homolog [Polistes dominula]XP_015182654.1 PREDICTED: TELO2-interacting protein 1 homolog [Polistes dominula]
MDRHELQKGFTSLKPLCDSLLKNPSINCSLEIIECIKTISDGAIQDLFDYILFPVIVHLQNEIVSKHCKEHLVKIIRAVLSKGKITKYKAFDKLYTIVLSLIYDKNEPQKVISFSEELKETVLLCIQDLLNNSFTNVIEELYTRQYAPKLAHSIYLSVSIAKHEKSRFLRLIAIETVMVLCYVSDSSNQFDIVFVSQVADTIMLLLPGIVGGLQEVALGSDIQGHKVTMMAIRAWARIIHLVMQDKLDEETTPSIFNIKEEVTNVIDPLENKLHGEGVNGVEKILNSTKRNREWLNAAAIKLNVLVRAMNPLRKHSHFKVRKELTTSISLLISKCARNMKPSIMQLIEYLISLSEDDNEEVKEEAKKSLDQINESYMKNIDMKPLVELLEESFYKLLTQLPRIIRSSDDSEQLVGLNHLCGYLRLLGKERLPATIQSAAHVRRLIQALVYIIEIDCNGITLLEDVGVKDFDDLTHRSQTHLWKQLKFIQDPCCKDKIVTICELLGTYSDLRILIDNIFQAMYNVPQHRKELIYLLNSIVNVPITCNNNTSTLSLYKEIIELYITEDFWYLPIEVTEDISLRVAQSNVVQCCLLTEGLGQIAKNLGRNFEKFLLKILYFVIERAGSTNSLLSRVGIETLENIAEALKYETIGDLLRANVDYFSYHVTIKLRRLERNPGVLDVVKVVMKYSSMDVLPCLKEIVLDVLLQLNSVSQKRNTYSFLNVFYIFILYIKKLTAELDANVTKTSPTLVNSKEERKANEQIDENFNDEITDEENTEKQNEQTETNSIAEEEEEEKKNLPTHIKMVEDVLKSCLHFLPSKDRKQLLIAMLTLEEGLPILIKYENQLLPIVHQIWHPLVDRFKDQNVLLINRSWQLLRVLAHVSKDFIRSRTLKQILPPLSDFMNKSAKESYKKSKDAAYQFTQMYKLQKELLSTLGTIVQDLNIIEKDLWNILSITEVYLSSLQHPILQQCCMNLYKELADYNGDMVLTKCFSIWHSKVAPIPINEIYNFVFLKNTTNVMSKEYVQNVKTIITLCDNKCSEMPTEIVNDN